VLGGLKDRSAYEIVRRYRPVLDSLQPSARSWAQRQARIEAKRPNLDLNALSAAIIARFAGQLPSGGSWQPSAGLVGGGDVADMAVIVILMMVQDGDDDLQEQMQEAQAQMQAKQALRAILSEMQQLQAKLASEPYCICSPPPCATDNEIVCTCSLSPLEGETLATCSVPYQVGSSCASDIPIDLNPETTCTTPGGANTVGITSQQLTAVIAQLQDKLDSDNELSEQTMMQLQMLMDERSKLLQTASEIEKSKSDAEQSMVGNLK
jgi:hypothetical protein